MDITLSGGDLGGQVMHEDKEPALGDIIVYDDHQFRYEGNGFAVFIGMVKK